ncbi:hypothetical protein MBLNU457_g0594t1 [Dothideomycetes sp. NU457]
MDLNELFSKGLPRSSTAPQHSHSQSHSHFGRHKSRHRHGPLARSTISNTLPQLKSPFDFDSYNPLKRGHLAPSNDTSRFASKESVNPKPQTPEPPPQTVTQADVDAERSLRSAREDDIQSTLRSLDSAAHDATRRLDDTYYALLERIGTLRSTVSALQKLYTGVEDGRREFESQTKELGEKTRGQLDEFGGFEKQEREIEGLVVRLETGRTKAKAVEERLEGVRSRLEKWDEHEKKRKKVSRRRWGVFWTVVGFVGAVLLTIVIWKGVQGREQEVITFVSDVTKQVEVGLGMERKTRRKNETVGVKIQGDEKTRRKKENAWNHVLDEL